MLKLPSVSLSFGKKSQTRPQDRSSSSTHHQPTTNHNSTSTSTSTTSTSSSTAFRLSHKHRDHHQDDTPITHPSTLSANSSSPSPCLSHHPTTASISLKRRYHLTFKHPHHHKPFSNTLDHPSDRHHKSRSPSTSSSTSLAVIPSDHLNNSHSSATPEQDLGHSRGRKRTSHSSSSSSSSSSSHALSLLNNHPSSVNDQILSSSSSSNRSNTLLFNINKHNTQTHQQQHPTLDQSHPNRMTTTTTHDLYADPSQPPDFPSRAMTVSNQMASISMIANNRFSPKTGSELNYSHHQLSLLRRHHTLSTAGTRLARLEKQQTFAHMGEKDRRFYGGSPETGSLSGSESVESLSIDSRSNFCLDPLELNHTYHHHTSNTNDVDKKEDGLLSDLSDLIVQPPSSSCHSTSRLNANHPPPLSQSGFQLIRAYKGTPDDSLGSPIEDGTKLVPLTPSHPMGKLIINHRYPRETNHSPIFELEHRPGTGTGSQSIETSGSLPLYTQVALHRNFSSPSKLQQSNNSDTPCTFGSANITSTSSSPSNNSLYLPSTWNALSPLGRTMNSSNESPLRALHTLQPVRSQAGSPHSFGQVTEEELFASPLDSPHPSSLHRTTSDRVSSTSQPSSTLHTLSHWSDQTTLRRHQSMKSDGKWDTCVVTTDSITDPQALPKEPSQFKDFSRKTFDALFDLGSSLGGQSTHLIRSSSDHSHNSSTFSTSLSTHPSPSGNIVSFSTQAGGGTATTMNSPVSVPGLSINPWSPSVEEAKKLREPILRQASFDTLASNSSNGSRQVKKSHTSDLTTRFRSSSNDDNQNRETNMLHSNFGRVNNVGSGKPATEDLTPRHSKGLSHRISGVKSPLSTSTSLVDLTDASADVELATPVVVAQPKKVVLPPLVTDFSRDTTRAGATQAQKPTDSIKRHPNGVSHLFQGPASAAAFVPPIGHSLSRNLNGALTFQEKLALMATHNTAAPGTRASNWLSQKERLVGESPSRQQTGDWSSPVVHSPSSQLPPASASLSAFPQQIQHQIILNQQLQQLQQLQLQQQQLQQQQAQLLGSTMGLTPSSTSLVNGFSSLSLNNHLQNYNTMSPASSGTFFGHAATPNPGVVSAPNPSRLQTTITGLPGLASLSGTAPHPLSSSVGSGASMMNMKPLPLMPHLGPVGSNNLSVQELAHQKGYNPTQFDLSPKSARFFVIKSYTEEDVHKSLKYEIWASTDLGNKRLDRAFNESHESGPIYLLFSVNASGHFCGMAEMLTPVDYNTTSKVWAQDKWKGIFKVKWVFVKDIPNSALRHLKLTNTPENKPITSSRDTQEVPLDKGIQVLQIMSSYQSRTTLLQDYAWYEHNESIKSQQQAGENRNQAAPTVLTQRPDSLNSHSSAKPRHARNSIQTAAQNIRRFTNAPSHAGQVSQVAVEVTSGI